MLMIVSRSVLLGMRNISEKVVEKIKTYIFSFNRARKI